MSFEDYLAYTDASTDDMPLYLFDCDFAHKAPQLAADYEVRLSALQTSVLLPGKSRMVQSGHWRLALFCAGHSWITACTARKVGPGVLPENTRLLFGAVSESLWGTGLLFCVNHSDLYWCDFQC